MKPIHMIFNHVEKSETEVNDIRRFCQNCSVNVVSSIKIQFWDNQTIISTSFLYSKDVFKKSNNPFRRKRFKTQSTSEKSCGIYISKGLI